MTENTCAPLPAKWQAGWIWHEPVAFMDNFHLLARRQFELDRVPRRAECWISANNLYELWINGHRVGRGTSPSYPRWQYVDGYDVTAHLRAGTNLIAVHAYNFGPDMASVLTQDPGPGGLIVQVEADGNLAAATDEHWRVLRDPSRQERTEPITGHRGGFKEVCDGRAEVIGWREGDFDDSAWSGARQLCGATDGTWENLIAREIPPLCTERVLPVEAYFHTVSEAYGAKRYDVEGPHALRADDDTCAVVHPLTGEFAPSIIVDFGTSCFGYYRVEIADSDGGVMELSYGESLNLTRVDRYTMRPGRQCYQAFERRGGRYLMLTFRDCPGSVKIQRVVCLRRSYPVGRDGRFRCSDERLNRIWDVGCHTVQMCMQDHYEDCPWREQTLYCGDVAVSALLSYYAFGSEDLGRKCLRQFARIQQEDGAIPTLGPAPCSLGVVPEYPAFWVIALWNHHRHWKDQQLVAELAPNLMACMKWYLDRLDDRGLFVRRKDALRFTFVDNLSNIPAQDMLAAEQIIIARSFRCAAEMARLTGNAEQARSFEKTADDMAGAIDRLFWSESAQCLVDSLAPGGDTHTQITNGLALLYDIVRPERRRALGQVLLDRTKAPPMRAGYMNFYMVEALAHSGMHHRARRRIEEYWGGMIDRGATTFWETFDPESPDGSLPQRLWSLCHAFCAAPVYSLPAHVAGIRAGAAGFDTVEIAPRLGDLHWVSSAVPTPRGTVCLICMKNQQTRCLEMEVTLPPATAAEVLVELPGRDFGTVYVGDSPVRPGAESQALQAVHAGLTEARIERGGVRLCFSAVAEPQTIRIRTTRTTAFPAGGVRVSEPAESWEASPPPL